MATATDPAETGLDKGVPSVWLCAVMKTGKESLFESVDEAEVECGSVDVACTSIDEGAKAAGRRRGMKVRGTRTLGPQGSPALIHSWHF